jgi:transcriptional regulator of nitric oxide reductase
MSSRRVPLALAVLALALSGRADDALAKVFHSQEEALVLAFPAADRVDRKTYILSDTQVDAIESLSRSDVETRLVTLYTGWRGGELAGYAHIDVHRVRTKTEGLMVVLDPKGVVREVRVLAFHEPLDYLPSERWYTHFEGKTATDGLRIGRDVDAVAGATLTTRAAADGVRRMLAYFEVLVGG